MIRCHHQQILIPQLIQQGRQPVVKITQGLRITVRISAMPVQHIIIHQINKAQSLKIFVQIFQSPVYTFRISRRVHRFRDSLSGENIPDLSHCDHILPRIRQLIQHGNRRRHDGKIMSAGRAGILSAAGTGKRSGNNSPHAMFSLQNLPGHAAVFIQFLHRNHLLMSGDLEHTVRRGIDNQITAKAVGIPVILNHRGSGIGTVAQYASLRFPAEGIQHFLRKSVRICGQRFRRKNACNLPMAYGGILSPGALRHPGNHRSMGSGPLPLPRRAGKLHAVYLKQPQFLHMRHMKIRAGRDGSQRIYIHVAVRNRILHSADTKTVQND